jgi:uncharacterized membrane protein YebE (DUF533 family)
MVCAIDRSSGRINEKGQNGMMRISLLIGVSAILGLAACEPTNERQANANCVVGAAGGAVLGGVLGNQVGGGTGQDIATVAGAAAGGLAGSQALCR